MRRFQRILFPLLAATAACDPAVHAAGRVLTASGAPIANAEVSLTVGGEKGIEYSWTDSLGHFSLTRWGSRRPPFEIRVCREGYQMAAQTIASLEALEDSLEFVLQPSGPVSAATKLQTRCSQPFRPAV